MYKTVLVLLVVTACALAASFTPATVPCGFTMSFRSDDNTRTSTHYFLQKTLQKSESPDADGKLYIDLIRFDVKDDSGKVLGLQAAGYDPATHTASSCSADYYPQEALEENFFHPIESYIKPFNYEVAVDVPEVCAGCKKYCVKAGDCKAATNEYYIVDDQDRIIQAVSGDNNYHVSYGPAPDLSVFAFECSACPSNYAAPTEGPCPAPAPSTHSSPSTTSSASRMFINFGVAAMLVAACLLF